MGMELPKTDALIQQFLRPCLKKEMIVSPGFCKMRTDVGLRADKITYPTVLDTAWEAMTHAELNAKGNLPDENLSKNSTVQSTPSSTTKGN